MFDPSGWMATQLTTKSSRKPWAGAPIETKRLNRTSDEVVAAFDSYAAYYGTYQVDTNVGTVTIRVQDAYVPGASGLTNVRYFEFQGDDRIVLLPAEDGKGGLLPRRAVSYKLIWDRIK
jgi:hypothetical protein